MPRLAALLVGTLALGACDETPAPAPPPAPVAKPSGFQFEPTLGAHRPQGSAMVLIAEVGNPATGALSLVLAHHDGKSLSLAAWRFASDGEDETLAPTGPPTPLLALRPGEHSDQDALEELVRSRAAGHTVGGRPQGVAATDARAALETLHAQAVAALEPNTSPDEQTRALAGFTRGLDDALLFSRTGVSRALETLAIDAAPSSAEGSERRASVRWGETTVSMLRKGDGWVIDALR